MQVSVSRRSFYAALGATAVLGVAAAIPGFAATSRPATVRATACTPAVSGLSYALLVIDNGSSLVPDTALGVAGTVLGSPLPAPLNKAQVELLTLAGTGATALATETPAATAELRSAIAVLATYNATINKVIGAGANGIDAGASTVGDNVSLHPYDTTLHQTASFLRDTEVTSPSC